MVLIAIICGTGDIIEIDAFARRDIDIGDGRSAGGC
jgi:hypothetical protein